MSHGHHPQVIDYNILYGSIGVCNLKKIHGGDMADVFLNFLSEDFFYKHTNTNCLDWFEKNHYYKYKKTL